MWSLLGLHLPYIWCHDSNWGSPLILVGPRFQLTCPTTTLSTWLARTHPSDRTHSHPTLGIFLVSPHTPIGFPLWSLPSVSLGFQCFPFLIISGTQTVGEISLFATGLGLFLSSSALGGCPPRKAWHRVTHSLHGPFWPANHLNSVMTDSHALCIFLDVCAVWGCSTVHNILLSHSGTGSLIMGASTSSLPSDFPLRCLLNNLDTLVWPQT
jgi:hypothetical protein